MFNYRKFLCDQFTDFRGLIGFLRAYRVEPPGAEAVKKWFARGTIPSEWFPLLLAFLEIEHGEPVRLASYMEVGK